MSGYEANIPYMAAKFGQYHGLSDTINGIADTFSSCAAGDLGPGGIAAALKTVAVRRTEVPIDQLCGTWVRSDTG